jgi:arabinogalactan endo-1,4-beta-galactosidase
MKFPSKYTSHFAISVADNGFILYYEDEIVDLDARSNTSVITKNKIYPETVEGQADLMTDIIELMNFFPTKHKDGIQIIVRERDK